MSIMHYAFCPSWSKHHREPWRCNLFFGELFESATIIFEIPIVVQANNRSNNHNNNRNNSGTDDNDGRYSRSARLRHRHGKTFRTLTRKQGIASPTPRLSCRARVLHRLGSWSNPTVSWQTCRNHLHQTPLLSGDPAKRWQRHQVPPPETTVKVGPNMAKSTAEQNAT